MKTEETAVSLERIKVVKGRLNKTIILEDDDAVATVDRKRIFAGGGRERLKATDLSEIEQCDSGGLCFFCH